MGEIKKCPICLQEHNIGSSPEERAETYYCNKGEYLSYIVDDVLECEDMEKEKRLNAIYNFVFQKPFYKPEKKLPWRFFYDETMNSVSEGRNINVYYLKKTIQKI